MDSREYWARREDKARRNYIRDEAKRLKALQDIYESMYDRIDKEINAFYAKYARDEGITMAEARRRADNLDIEAYARKAKKYVKKRNFSQQANDEMKLYNLTMKANRLELLKANIGLELVKGFEDLQMEFGDTLTERAIKEDKRQAGILGDSVFMSEKAAETLVNASFHHATYSERIWMHQAILKAEIDKQLRIGLIQGKNPKVLARAIRDRFKVSQRDAERLMITELARVQSSVQKASFERNGYDEYEFIAEPTACPICRALHGKHFKVADMLPGENCEPMHPRCKCSTAAYAKLPWEDDKQYFQKVTVDRDEVFTRSEKEGKITAHRISTIKEDVYLSDKAKIKPRTLHAIMKTYRETLDKLGATGYATPRMTIIADTELKANTAGRYSPLDNVLYIKPQKNPEEQRHTIIHELYHWKDAQEYQSKNGAIRDQGAYIRELCKVHKKILDQKGVTEYTVNEIGQYAYRMFKFGRYDEVYTEYRTKKFVGGNNANH